MTTIQFADGSAVTDAIADVRNDATETNWTLVTVFFCFWCVCVLGRAGGRNWGVQK